MAGREIQGEHGVFAAREGEQFGELFAILFLWVIGFLIVIGYIVEIKEYNEAKKSGDWIVCEATLIDSYSEYYEDSDGDRYKQYFHVFEYEAPNGKTYEHVEKTGKEAKDRLYYEVLVKEKKNSESIMRPFEASGVDVTFIFGIIIVLLPVPILIRLIYVWKNIPDWRSKYDL
ncbi:MAG: hypothetical protein E7288_06630 [Lachnospiraceae bacterium]|nr:hypothetical protein [Lachnospiraceae bacterium]